MFIDTTYNLPTGGTTWAAHTAADFMNALNSSNPGDVIVLDAGTTYSGTFNLPIKTNPSNKWIYVISSKLSSLPAAGACVQPWNPAPGTCVDPSSAVNMPTITTVTAVPPITVVPGASYWRLAGLHVTSNSTKGCTPLTSPPENCFSYSGISIAGTVTNVLPDHIYVDRCYIHGSDTQDLREGVFGNGTYVAVTDSYISDIHQSLFDSQAFVAYATPGPIKIVNNFMSATTEDMMLGGAGGPDNPYVPSDIEVQNNWFFKPLKWEAVGITIQPKNKWVVKDNWPAQCV